MKLIESHRVPMARVYAGSRFYLDYLAGRADPETTKLHDRRDDRVSLGGIERIGI